jgi:hypothetical protein
MEHPKYLIDTNVVSDYIGAKLMYQSMDFMNIINNTSPSHLDHNQN